MLNRFPIFLAVKRRFSLAFFRSWSKLSGCFVMEKAPTIFSNGRLGKSSARLPQIAMTGIPYGVRLAPPIGAFPDRL